MFSKINSFLKDIIIASRVAYIIYPFRKLLLFLYNLSELTHWVHRNKHLPGNNDYFLWKRNYNKRIKGFDYLLNTYQLQQQPFSYFEFGVASGVSFEWWLSHAQHPGARFFGFDTFEGLPEDWGLFFKKGAMAHDMKAIEDNRHLFIKGIFQDTLAGFIRDHSATLNLQQRKVLLLDADLFSSTIFVLSQFYPYMKKGDLIIFDEFNVPNHEFQAMKIFRDCFYVQLKPVSALNNFYQAVFEVQ